MDRIRFLLLRFLREEITPAERAELDAWLATDPDNRALLAELQDPDELAHVVAGLGGLKEEAAWEKVAAVADRLRPEVEGGGRVRLLWVRRLAAAAVVVVLLGVGVWWLSRRASAPAPAVAAKVDVAAPVRNRATLTLSSGRQIALDSVADGALARQGEAQVVKQLGGQLAYRGVGLTQGALLYNTLSNPRGSRVISLALSDGTKVWLDAESSIRYPAVFGGDRRAVEVTGEAYFDVVKDAARPFKVTAVGETVTVLGTAFNVNAYTDETAVRTTLADGAIAVRAGGDDKLLKPGQQAVYDGTGGRLSVDTHADLEQVLAWKNGQFSFADADLGVVLRQLARWYDITVIYKGILPHREFNGEIGRDLSLDQVLHILTNHKIHYTIRPDRTLIIQP